jgi:SecD/SecF fusion protein
MPKNYSGRIITILFVLLGSLWAIFPSGNLKKPDLKPGIDMVGGTSLLYQIKPGPGPVPPDLANQVMESLKKRVDPQGVRNLVWRPQGNTRIEIQMPLTKHNENAAKIRDDFAAAQKTLDATNVRPSAVVDAVEQLKGDARTKRLNELAMGDPTRTALFQQLATTWDQLSAARAARDIERDVALDQQYQALQAKIDDTNLSVRVLSDTLDLKSDLRNPKIAAIKEQYKAFPERLAAIDAFTTAYLEYAQVKHSIDDAAELKRLLKGSGVLEFHILVTDYNTPEAQMMVNRLERSGPVVQAGDTMRWYQIDHPEDWQQPKFPYNDKFYALAFTTPGKSMTNGPGITRWSLQRAHPTVDQNGSKAVGFEFDAVGAMYFSDLTGANINQPLASILDQRIITAPNINGRIGASGIITGSFSDAELRYMISTLNAGSLPAQLSEEPISERTVGPQLGADNLRRGLFACVFGVVVVAFFLIGYYYLSGVVAMIAVLLNLVIILGVMAALEATFTLPSIAGVILTIGMAVDANVLIFERLREEQLRGLSLQMALRNAYDRAFTAILDGNVTTGITSLVLYWFGSEEVKGFGLTLLIGIVSSLFTALFVTKTLFGLGIDFAGIKKLGSLPLTFPKWDRALRPNIDWMGKAWMFYAFSAVFIIGGLVAFGTKFAQGRMLDIEFSSGTQVQFELLQPTPQDQVRDVINQYSHAHPDQLPAPSVVAVGNDDLSYEVVSPNQRSGEVKSAVLTALAGRLKLEAPSSFASVGAPVEAAVTGGAIVPVTSATQRIAGFIPDSLGRHVGGAAIVLQNLNPPLAPDEIARRIERQRLQPLTGDAAPDYRPFDVESPTGPGKPATTAVILVSDPDLAHGKDAAKWRDLLAAPMWSLAAEAINKPADLQRVTNFDAQVAGETQMDALLAMAMSTIAIMLYIWVRFGNLKYGTATVWALLHDTLFVLAAIGFAHYVSEWAVGQALLIEPFRINLTMVAAILTVMGYSMNDTVVVFDRVRENRGKQGHVTRQLVNDSINQTLSRTLLTGGTTILTIFVMYISGGPGVHGFTFALLVGILAGTYSSIAIAAPLVLIGTRTPEGQQGSGLTKANRPAASVGG